MIKPTGLVAGICGVDLVWRDCDNCTCGGSIGAAAASHNLHAIIDQRKHQTIVAVPRQRLPKAANGDFNPTEVMKF